MRHTGDGTHSDVLIDEIVGCEVYERIIWLNWIFISSFSKLRQLINRDTLHSLEYFYQIIWLLAELGIVGEGVELAVNASGPTRHLVVHNVHLLELFL